MPISVCMQEPISVSTGFENNRQQVNEVKAAGSLHFTFNRLSKWIALATFIVVVLWRHDAMALWTAMGSVLNVILSAKLKLIFNRKRPSASMRSDPGMPSSHSQSIFFVAIFTNLSVVENLGTSDFTFTICGAILAYSSYLAWLRVYAKQHTKSQVIAGASVGSFFCSYWCYIWKVVVLHAFATSLWIRIVISVGTSGIWIWFVLAVLRKRV